MGHSQSAKLIYGIAIEDIPEEAYEAVDGAYNDEDTYLPLSLSFSGYDFNGPTIVGYKATEIRTSESFGLDYLPTINDINTTILIDFCNEFGFDKHEIKWQLIALYG